MRISDWSSDVCSSDLERAQPGAALPADDADLGGRLLSAGGAGGYPRRRPCVEVRRTALRLHGLGALHGLACLGAPVLPSRVDRRPRLASLPFQPRAAFRPHAASSTDTKPRITPSQKSISR